MRDTCGIHAGYMRDTPRISGGLGGIQARSQVGLIEIRILMCISCIPYVSDMYVVS
jgi:hypothetical protein